MSYLVTVMLLALAAGDEVPHFEAEQIFPPVERQTHAPGIVETPSGELIASWYGDPDRDETDSGILVLAKGRVRRAGANRFRWRTGRAFPIATPA